MCCQGSNTRTTRKRIPCKRVLSLISPLAWLPWMPLLSLSRSLCLLYSPRCPNRPFVLLQAVLINSLTTYPHTLIPLLRLTSFFSKRSLRNNLRSYNSTFMNAALVPHPSYTLRHTLHHHHHVASMVICAELAKNNPPSHTHALLDFLSHPHLPWPATSTTSAKLIRVKLEQSCHDVQVTQKERKEKKVETKELAAEVHR